MDPNRLGLFLVVHALLFVHSLTIPFRQWPLAAHHHDERRSAWLRMCVLAVAMITHAQRRNEGQRSRSSMTSKAKHIEQGVTP